MDVSLSELRELVMDREAWHVVVHGIAKIVTRLSDWTELNWSEIKQWIRCSVKFLVKKKSLLFLLNTMPSSFIHISSVQFTHSVVSDFLQPHGLQHTRPPCPLPTPGVYSNSCPWSRWCHPTISSSVIPFSSCPQSFPASGSFPMSQFFTSRSQSIEVSASASVIPMNIQDWFPLGWTGWISLLSKGLSRVFSNTTVQKHQFFGTSLWPNSHIHTQLLEKS